MAAAGCGGGGVGDAKYNSYKAPGLRGAFLEAAHVSCLEDRYALGPQLGWGQFGVIRSCSDLVTGEALACKSIAKGRLRRDGGCLVPEDGKRGHVAGCRRRQRQAEPHDRRRRAGAPGRGGVGVRHTLGVVHQLLHDTLAPGLPRVLAIAIIVVFHAAPAGAGIDIALAVVCL